MVLPETAFVNVGLVSGYRRKRQRAFEDMSSTEMAPRLALLSVLCTGSGVMVLLQIHSDNLLALAVAPLLRPLGWLGIALGVALVPIAALIWRHGLRAQGAFSRTGFTRADLRKLSPDQFEEWCADRLRERGYQVTIVGGQSDHGVDLIAERDGRRMVVQCKRWFGIRLVGEPQVRDLYGAMQHEQASTAMVITTGQYSEAATKWAENKPIRLCGAEQLLAGTPLAAIKPTAITAASKQQCPSCGRDLLRRTNRRTQDVFWGCSGYPTCRFTRAS